MGWLPTLTRRRAPGWLASVLFCLCATASLPREALATKPLASHSDEQDLPLPELPKAPPIRLREPTQEQVQRLSELISRLTAPESLTRENATAELLEVTATWEPAIARTLNTIANQAKREDMKKLLSEVRVKSREAKLKEMKAHHETGAVKVPDYLVMLQDFPRVDSEAWRNTVTILGLSRMLVQIGSVSAARSLIDVYVRFGDFLRVDTQLQLDKLGDVAVAALIETEQHPSAKISNWAKRQLDLRHRAIPSDAVRGAAESALPEILRAYGLVKNPDAARIIVSFTNSERAQLRLAARQAISLMGVTALWQLRDTYEDVVGRKAPRDWSWERMARELFREFDRLTLASVHQLFREGLEHRAQGQLLKMSGKFDQVLVRNPNFEASEQLAQGYLEFAVQAETTSLSQALVAAERAERLAKGSDLQQKASSQRLALEAQNLFNRGIADATLLENALANDPRNATALRLKAQFESTAQTGLDSRARYGAAIATALAALAAVATILRRQPKAAGSSEP